ncbi:MAG: MBOAT family protein [Clostridiales bacterium]|nr:MBOAT family protein [Clostridiales bacterium]
MLFNSFSFLLFFPIVTLIYFLVPHKIRYLWLLGASYFFYMSWNPKYALLIATSTVITYLSGLLIDSTKSRFKRKLWVGLSFASNLAILFFFKYFDFAVGNLGRVMASMGIEFMQPTFDVILPVGISFYTFQALSYTMDVYRREIFVEKNIAKYALFVSFFPQLVAGPIERSKNLLVQIEARHYFDYDRVKSGLLIMLWGLFLKLVIADRVAILVNQVYGDYAQYAGLQLVIATLLFGIQIYCDFGSYSYIAIGSAQVMGFTLMENFKQPYFARSITEFCQRWHISLSTWFRDYLYIPLGGNRKGKFRKYINIMIVFIVSGLWHGASWNFVIWGALHGIFQVIGLITSPFKAKVADRLGVDRINFSYQLGQGIITFILVNFAWIFFRAPNFTAARGIIDRILLEWNPWIFSDGSLYELGLSRANLTVAMIGIFIMIGTSIAKRKGFEIRATLARQGLLFRWSVYFALIFTIIIFGIYGPGYSESQFLYFQF